MSTRCQSKFPTDSETICYAINELGIEKTWDKLEYCNPGTLIFWNAKDKTINMITNNARPIFFSFLEDQKAMVWASEEWMYEGICKRNNVKLHKNDEGVSTFFLNRDVVYTFKYDKKEKKVSYSSKKVEFTKTYNHTPYSYGAGYGQIDWDNRGKCDAPFHKPTNIPTSETGKKTTLTVGPVARTNPEKFRKSLGGAAKGIGMHDFYQKYNFCVGCDESLLDEYAKCFILDDKSAFCSECIDGFIALGIQPDKQLSVN
jgi:hypothetical protein